MLDGWTILNVRRRVDRRLVGVAQAHFLNIPLKQIHIWEAKDAESLGIDDADILLDAIAEDGFPEFRDSKRFKKRRTALGRICQLWNVCRFLRHLININETHMLIHDGVKLKRNNWFIPSYSWWTEIITHLNAHARSKDAEFLALLNGHRRAHYTLEKNLIPIEIGSEILQGISAFDNHARVYSPAGAKLILERILTRPISDANHILGIDSKHDTEFLSTPGFYSMRDTLFTDCPPSWLGSNRVDHLVSYRDEYERLFPPDIIPNEWKTGGNE